MVVVIIVVGVIIVGMVGGLVAVLTKADKTNEDMCDKHLSVITAEHPLVRAMPHGEATQTNGSWCFLGGSVSGGRAPDEIRVCVKEDGKYFFVSVELSAVTFVERDGPPTIKFKIDRTALRRYLFYEDNIHLGQMIEASNIGATIWCRPEDLAPIYEINKL
jgi:hypothetical protein